MISLTAVTEGKGRNRSRPVASFAIRQEWWTGEALPEAKVVRRELAGVPKVEVVGPVQGEGGERSSGTRSPRSGPTWPGSRGNDFRYFVRRMEQKRAWRLDIAALIRHDDCMDRRALERLGHHVVSRRVALGYRNRTDLADSLQFTVRTLADIEHGVRKASPGTYAMLENKLAWAPGSIDTILAGGEPQELVPTLRRTNPNARPGIRTAPDQPQRPVAGVHRGVAAGAATPHHRPPRQTPQHLGRLGRP